MDRQQVKMGLFFKIPSLLAYFGNGTSSVTRFDGSSVGETTEKGEIQTH